MFSKIKFSHNPITIIFFVASFVLYACGTTPSDAASRSAPLRASAPDSEDVKSANRFLDSFQEAYSNMDIAGVSELFMENGAVVTDFEGRIRRYTSEGWLEMTGSIFKNSSRMKDRLTEREITVYRNIAVVNCRYDFDSPSEHSTGYDIFSLVRHEDSWLIVPLIYSDDRK